MGIFKTILLFFLIYWLYGAITKLFNALSMSGSNNSRGQGRKASNSSSKSSSKTSYNSNSGQTNFDQKKRKMESDLSEEIDFEEIK